MTDAVDHAKRALRAALRDGRNERSDAARREAAIGVTDQLDALVDRTGAHSMSCFLSTPTEPGTRGFVEQAVGRGIRILLPITRVDGLDWSVAADGFDVTEGLFGLPEPVGDVVGPTAVDDVDLLVIPAAAVDRAGMRLGWGRGYYDKTIGSIKRRPPVYAVIFDTELLDEVPTDAHDQGVDGIVTPSQTLTFAASRR